VSPLGHLERPLDTTGFALGVPFQEGGEQRGELRAGVVAAPGHDRPAALHPQVDTPVDGAHPTISILSALYS
jgi:hypothetical protein